MRPRQRGGGVSTAAPSKRITIKISSKSIPVRHEPSRFGFIICQLQENYIVQAIDDAVVEDVTWLKLNSGWICARDTNGLQCYTIAQEVEANRFWAHEYDNRRRVASAIGQMIARSNSLTNARRITHKLHEEAINYTKRFKPLTNLPDVSIEDLIIALSTTNELKTTEIFEFMKVASSQQSDPPKSLVGIATEVNDMIGLRPSLWVKNSLGILNTVDIQMRNDLFIMSSARGDMKTFDKCLASGQELAVVHSELKYTALHAAADFGAINVVEKLLNCGISPNVRDARFGRTALHFAAQSGRSEIARILLDKGADRTITCYQGFLPFEVAHDHGHVETREILKQPPPEIQHAQISGCTATSISVSWTPPLIMESIHAVIDEYMVVHEPLDTAKFGHGKRYTTKETHLTVSKLKSSTGHGFVILSHSAAGWSKASAKLIHFTLPTAPCAPLPVELIKVQKNGMLLSWYPPAIDNGGKVDLYMIEMTTEAVIEKEYSDTESELASNIDGSRAGNSYIELVSSAECSPRSQVSEASSAFEQHVPFAPLSRSSLSSIRENKGDKWHRTIKHRDVSKLKKYVTGLETYRDYYFRLACRNEYGWSAWSEWAGPFTPQEGVQVREFGDTWMQIGWVEPQLINRKVTCYEVQMCLPTGPMTSKINVYESKQNRKSSGAAYDFETIFDDVKEGRVVVENMKPGIKYQFRVRPKIENEWVDWDLCLYSDVISMPSCAPEVPHSLSVARRVATNYGIEEEYSVITHDSIELCWMNGIPNGSAIVETEVQCAKVRDYHMSDIERALNAAETEVSWQEAEGVDENPDALKWNAVTHQGQFTSASSFLVKGLTPGTCYTFRVRQRNDVQWSAYSRASAVIATLIACPPEAPDIISVSSSHAVVQWKMPNSSAFEFTCLEYDLRIQRIHANASEMAATRPDALDNEKFGAQWERTDTRKVKDENENSNIHRVVVDNLSPMTNYILKVRVKTVAGWTTWSSVSRSFATMSLPS